MTVTSGRAAYSAAYLLGVPLLGDFLGEGLSLLVRSCAGFERDRL